MTHSAVLNLDLSLPSARAALRAAPDVLDGTHPARVPNSEPELLATPPIASPGDANHTASPTFSGVATAPDDRAEPVGEDHCSGSGTSRETSVPAPSLDDLDWVKRPRHPAAARTGAA